MNILSFDIEEWFHILDHGETKTEKEWSKFDSRIHANVDRILTLLDDHEQKATFFCLGWVARNYPDIVRKIDEADHEIASHSDQHQLAYEQTPDDFERDLATSLASLGDVIGRRVNTYRIPGFSLTAANMSWVFDKLLEAGIEIDCSVFPVSRAHGGLPEFSAESPTRIKCCSGELREMPMNSGLIFGKRMVFSGGGYFRLLPYRMIRNLSRDSDYVMTYFHPRDFDKGQPIIPGLSPWRYFKSYYGLGSCERKLRRYITDFEFETVGQAQARVDWDAAPVVSI